MLVLGILLAAALPAAAAIAAPIAAPVGLILAAGTAAARDRPSEGVSILTTSRLSGP